MACAGFLVGGMVPALWWVELGFFPLVGWTISRGVFRGGCELDHIQGCV